MRERRPHRLPLDAYSVEGSVWHVTICVLEGVGSPFRDIVLGGRMLGALEAGIENRGAIPHVICLMPDHVHALIEVRSLGLVDLIARVKAETTRIWWSNGGNGKLWQKNFYDRGIRKSDDFDVIAAYVLENPVRAGLVSEWEEYPLISGTLITGM